MNSPPESQTSTGEAPVRKDDPLAEFEAVVGTIRQSAFRYMLAAADSVRLRVRQALLRALLLVSALFIVLLTMSVGAALLLIGASQALAAAFALPLWAGLLVVGGVAAILPILLVRVGLAINQSRSVERTRERISERANAMRRNDL